MARRWFAVQWNGRVGRVEGGVEPFHEQVMHGRTRAIANR